jgi:hypothetical protein
VDSDGAAYITGQTFSTNFPVTSGAYQQTHFGGSDLFFTKLAANGTGPVFSTLVGGSNGEAGLDIVVDENHVSHVAAYADSPNLPTTAGAFQQSVPTEVADNGYTVSVNASGSGLYHASYFAATSFDGCYAIDVNGSGSALWLAGYTQHATFYSTSGAYQVVNHGGDDAYIAKLSIPQSTLDYCTLLGGAGDDLALGIECDAQDSPTVVGTTYSSDFPLASAIDQTFQVREAFVCKMSPAGSVLQSSTFLGGSGIEDGNAITRRGAYVFVTGTTASSDFPLFGSIPNGTFGGGKDAYCVRFAMP